MKVTNKDWSELSKLQRDAVYSLLALPPGYRSAIQDAIWQAVQKFDEIDSWPVRQHQHDLLQAISAYATRNGSFG